MVKRERKGTERPEGVYEHCAAWKMRTIGIVVPHVLSWHAPDTYSPSRCPPTPYGATLLHLIVEGYRHRHWWGIGCVWRCVGGGGRKDSRDQCHGIVKKPSFKLQCCTAEGTLIPHLMGMGLVGVHIFVPTGEELWWQLACILVLLHWPVLPLHWWPSHLPAQRWPFASIGVLRNPFLIVLCSLTYLWQPWLHFVWL